MKKKTILNVVLVAVGLAVSLFLSFGGESIYDNLGINTPGHWAARIIVPPQPWNWGAIGDRLRTEMFIDWIFWFAVLYLIYFSVRRIGRRSTNKHR